MLCVCNLEMGFQDPHSGSQTSVTQIAGEPASFYGILGHQAQTYMQAKQVYTYNFKMNNKSSTWEQVHRYVRTLLHLTEGMSSCPLLGLLGQNSTDLKGPLTFIHVSHFAISIVMQDTFTLILQMRSLRLSHVEKLLRPFESS